MMTFPSSSSRLAAFLRGTLRLAALAVAFLGLSGFWFGPKRDKTDKEPPPPPVVQPVPATPAEGIPLVPPPVGRTDNLGDYGAAAHVYVSLPYNPPVGGIILVHDAMGLDNETRSNADRFASAGYLAVAVDLFEGKVPKDHAGAAKLVENINPAGVERILRATMRYLHEEPAVQVQKVAILGWGIGGEYALGFARGRQDVAALILYYSPVPDQLASVVELSVPVLGIFARKDPGISMARVDGFRDAMKAAGRYAEIVRYDADHGFATVGAPTYHGRWARDAHQRVLSFLQRTFYIAMPTALPAP